MSYQRSSRPNRDCVLPRNSIPYSCSSMQPSQLDTTRAYLPTHNMSGSVSNYPNIRAQNHAQSTSFAPPAPFFTKPGPDVISAKHNLYDYGKVDYTSLTLQTRSCENCGCQYRCTRSAQDHGLSSSSLALCDQCLTNYAINGYSPHTTSFSPPALSPGYNSNSNYGRPASLCSPRANPPHLISEVPSLSPPGPSNFLTAMSPNPNCSSRSNASKSSAASPATSHSAGSSAGKEAFEPATKRPHARGYITTLDARLSRLEAMLGELVPSAAGHLGPGATKSSNSEGKPNKESEAKSSKSKGKAHDNPQPTFHSRRTSLGIPEDPILDGALEDALLAARPVYSDSHLGMGTLYGPNSGTGSKTHRHPLSSEISTMHLLLKKI